MFENKSNEKNLDLKDKKDLNYYLSLSKDWVDPFPSFVIKKINEFNIIDESVLKFGSKVRYTDLLFKNIKEEEVVYVAMRYGFAPISLAYMAKKYNKKLTL